MRLTEEVGIVERSAEFAQRELVRLKKMSMKEGGYAKRERVKIEKKMPMNVGGEVRYNKKKENGLELKLYTKRYYILKLI